MAKVMADAHDEPAEAPRRRAFTDPLSAVVPWIYVSPSGGAWAYAWLNPFTRPAVQLIVWTSAGKRQDSRWPTWAAAVAEASRLEALLVGRGWARRTQLETPAGWVLASTPRDGHV